MCLSKTGSQSTGCGLQAAEARELDLTARWRVDDKTVIYSGRLRVLDHLVVAGADPAIVVPAATLLTCGPARLSLLLGSTSAAVHQCI